VIWHRVALSKGMRQHFYKEVSMKKWSLAVGVVALAVLPRLYWRWGRFEVGWPGQACQDCPGYGAGSGAGRALGQAMVREVAGALAGWLKSSTCLRISWTSC